MPTVEELEQRVSRLESLYEDVIKERLNLILSRLDQIYEKTERDKTEILTKMANDKTEILAKTEKDKTELIRWMIGLLVGFATIIITATGIILSFALK
ncbi:MAG: hypothetical protein ACOYU0_00870 [Nitrospirota bacterium]